MEFLYFVLIGLLGIFLGRFFAVRRYGTKEELKELGEKGREAVAGKIESRKEKILELAQKQGKITNDDVENMFCGISNDTARRYLDELEKEGKLKQVGETGRGVHYTR